jgi:LPXTG-motif cell wall-anchored protein
MAQKNPNLVLGGLAALVIGAGLMRKRGMAR